MGASITSILPRGAGAAGPRPKREPALSREVRDLIPAAERAPVFLVSGNMPENFRLGAGIEVDPHSVASEGTDGKGNPIWVVDQKLTFRHPPADLSRLLVDGYLTGRAAGCKRNGPAMTVTAVKRGENWEAPGGARSNPFSDPAVGRCILKVENVRPVPVGGSLLRPASFYLTVDKRSIVAGRDRAEFTVHFVNPENRSGPIPGQMDGAVRYRAVRNGDGTVTMEGYYVNRAAKEYLHAISDFIPPAKIMETALSFIPFGRSAAEKSIAATGAVRLAVAAFHSQYYRNVLFPNLLQNARSPVSSF